MYEPLLIEPLQEGGLDALRVVIGNSAALLGANEIEELIRYLSHLRAQMLPAPPPAPVESVTYTLEVDPSWHVDKSPLLEGSTVLMLRHAGFGWIAFSLPPQSIAKLQAALTVRPPFAMSPVAN
ncbi:hypothetical protein B0G80_5135 [Paraburkholderia sp. BL6669N2]|uniref:hypothetical protein n=1 Tax=Paraburkholderia sp. BL6669N2 TaxID=1938807 RepID=UPI000E37C629|nr:hypothetical protein [Paraburkholderia sp. BL6669N2]REG48830.1 hypothetical protein B0G80_5135 [Paraburkholderia sp. BL6669N2]